MTMGNGIQQLWMTRGNGVELWSRDRKKYPMIQSYLPCESELRTPAKHIPDCFLGQSLTAGANGDKPSRNWVHIGNLYSSA